MCWVLTYGISNTSKHLYNNLNYVWKALAAWLTMVVFHLFSFLSAVLDSAPIHHKVSQTHRHSPDRLRAVSNITRKLEAGHPYITSLGLSCIPPQTEVTGWPDRSTSLLGSRVTFGRRYDIILVGEAAIVIRIFSLRDLPFLKGHDCAWFAVLKNTWLYI